MAQRGRPRLVLDMDRIRQLRQERWGLGRIARELKVGKSTLRRALKPILAPGQNSQDARSPHGRPVDQGSTGNGQGRPPSGRDGPDLASQSSPLPPIHPDLAEALLKTKKLKNLANGKHADLWESLDQAYGHYEWLHFDEEVLKADAWIGDDPKRTPTERGLPVFIRNWFDRAVEKGRPPEGGGRR